MVALDCGSSIQLADTSVHPGPPPGTQGSSVTPVPQGPHLGCADMQQSLWVTQAPMRLVHREGGVGNLRDSSSSNTVPHWCDRLPGRASLLVMGILVFLSQHEADWCGLCAWVSDQPSWGQASEVFCGALGPSSWYSLIPRMHRRHSTPGTGLDVEVVEGSKANWNLCLCGASILVCSEGTCGGTMLGNQTAYVPVKCAMRKGQGQ